LPVAFLYGETPNRIGLFTSAFSGHASDVVGLFPGIVSRLAAILVIRTPTEVRCVHLPPPGRGQAIENEPRSG